uniref:Ig-like domain-containing protein n=1 Tax=Callorhinchus milii TaxID=7868 RepID=A0A4W3GFY2_CALMI
MVSYSALFNVLKFCFRNILLLADVCFSQSPPEQTAFAGETINVHCQYSGFCGQDFSVSWYRQSPGETLKYLLHRNPSGEGGNPTGDHISASLDTAKKISDLTIADLRLTDSAMYHCALSLHHSDTHHRKPRTITLITTKAGKQYSTVSDRQCNKPSHNYRFLRLLLPSIPRKESPLEITFLLLLTLPRKSAI